MKIVCGKIAIGLAVPLAGTGGEEEEDEGGGGSGGKHISMCILFSWRGILLGSVHNL